MASDARVVFTADRLIEDKRIFPLHQRIDSLDPQFSHVRELSPSNTCHIVSTTQLSRAPDQVSGNGVSRVATEAHHRTRPNSCHDGKVTVRHLFLLRAGRFRCRCKVSERPLEGHVLYTQQPQEHGKPWTAATAATTTRVTRVRAPAV